MFPNRVDDADLIGTLVERAILETVEEVGDAKISGDDLTARARMRYAELSKPFTMSQEGYMAETISGTFLDVGERLILGGGKKEFDADVLVETVIDESMATFERTLGAPADETKARAAIRQYIDDVHRFSQGGELTPATTLRQLGQRFLAHKRDLERSDGTIETYGYAVTAHITPRLGDLTVAEAKPDRLQKFLNTVHRESGPGAAKNCRSTLSGMMALAVSNGAAPRNPVRDIERISQPKGKRGSSAIEPQDLPDLMKKLRAAPSLIEQDTVELFEFMLASGWRVGEACALDVGSIDFDAETAEVEATNVRVTGRGIVRQAVPKTESAWRVTPLPRPTMDLLRRRHERLKDDTTLLFPTVLMRLRDPSNTQRELRDIREDLGYPQLSTHTFRKTAATMLDRAGMSAAEIAAYLGHANPSMTQDVYMNTLKGDTRAGSVMQAQLSGLI